jgi:putative glutamine amidotransferase
VIRIGITDCGKFDNYRRWIESEEGVEVVKLSMHLENSSDADDCDGIIFSGGEDLHPERYGRPEFVVQYGLTEIIPARDQFEYEVLDKTLQKKPVLGICRGLQLINVYLGGDLVPDIPDLHRSAAHGKIDGKDQSHFLRVEPGTLLHRICVQELGVVNSAHHQSAGLPAPSLKISAFSEPSIIEAMEWKEPGNKSWLLMVQWHPERMTDPDSPFSAWIKTSFLNTCRDLIHDPDNLK